MQEGDTHQAFAPACHFCRRGTGLLVVLYLLVQLLHIFQRVFLAPQLNHGRQQGITGTGRFGVGHDDLSLVFRLQQIVPAFRRFQVLFLKQFAVGSKAQITYIDPYPESVPVPVPVGNFGCVGRDVFFQQSVRFCLNLSVSWSAEPDGSFRRVFFRFQAL